MTDNELIADFMGFYITSDRIGVDGKPDRVWKSNESPYLGGFRIPHLNQFESKWDWLMPVVEKIETINGHSYACRIVKDRCIIYDTHISDQTDVHQGHGKGILGSTINTNSKLKSVYWSVVEFIKWYQTQK